MKDEKDKTAKKSPQHFSIQLDIVQECEDDMTGKEMVKWVESHFKGCDYGRVGVTLLQRGRVR